MQINWLCRVGGGEIAGRKLCRRNVNFFLLLLNLLVLRDHLAVMGKCQAI